MNPATYRRSIGSTGQYLLELSERFVASVELLQ
jgi:hypothetical protein